MKESTASIRDSGRGPVPRGTAFQEGLLDIADRIHAAEDTYEILVDLQKDILGLFDADRMTIYTVDGLHKQIVSLYKTGDEVKEIRVPIDKTSISGFCAATGRRISVADAYDKDELRRIHPAIGFNRSYDQETGYRTLQVLAAPIIHRRYLLGVIQLINKRGGGRFTPEDQASAERIAKVLGIAFFNNQKALLKKPPTKFEYLVRKNILDQRELEQAMGKARKEGRPLESVLLEAFGVAKRDIGRALEDFFRAPFIAFERGQAIPDELLKDLKPGFLKKNLFVPVARKGETILVTLENPDHLPSRDTIRRVFPGERIEYGVSIRADILKMIDHAFSRRVDGCFEDPVSIEELIDRLGIQEESGDTEPERVNEADGVIVQLVNKMIRDAHKSRASDIHIEPGQGRKNAVIRFRIDGVCRLYQTLPHTLLRAVLSRLKIMAELDIAERRLPQDGKIQFKKFGPGDIELRVATMPTTGGNEDMVLRLLVPGETLPLEDMGFNERNYRTFLDMITRPYGIVLVVGPTGSGKTTTLHAALRAINTFEVLANPGSPSFLYGNYPFWIFSRPPGA